MKIFIAAWAAVCAVGATLEQNVTSLDNLEIQTRDKAEVPDSSDRTTILFSGFYLPSTAPPTLPTTLLTDIPEQLETTIHNEVRPAQNDQPMEEVMQPFQKVIKTPHQFVQDQLRQLVQPGQKEEMGDYLVTSKASNESNQKTDINNMQPDQSDAVASQKTETSYQTTKPSDGPTEKSYQNTDKLYLQTNEVYGEQAYHLEKGRLVTDHPCRRDCRSANLMTCKYRFVLEWYESLSKACQHCPHNITDCYREDCIPTDGMQRPLVVVNRKLPGPSIEVCVGDKVEIELENRLMAETTTIHWHGLHQRESPYMDGVPYVSQCPLLPKATFVYRYIALNTGTHFWHSHSGTQRADGMFGALIVRSGEDPHRSLYDEDLSEHTIQLIDWSHQLTVAVFTGHHHAQVDNKPPTLLVNGRGIYGHQAGVKVPPASFTVERGKSYRFRLINAGVLNCPIELSIDNHTMLAISSDGSDIVPVEVESLVSYAGERWDFILKANATADNYWMRFRGLMDCDERFTSAHTVAVLHYSHSSDDLPTAPVGYMLGKKTKKVLNPLNEKIDNTSINANELQSLTPVDRSLKPTPDRRVILSFDFYRKDNPHLYKKGSYGFHEVAHKKEQVLTPQLNHVSLILPPFPLLSQYSDLKKGMLCSQQNLKNCSKKFCECINIIELKLGEVVELILIDIGKAYDANHPFHLHGHAFRVVAMERVGNNTTVDEILALETQGSIKRNLINPPVKDTVTVPDGGYTIVRFIADNPGYWMFHCHLEFHVELGMAVIFQVGAHSDFPLPPAGFPKCGNYISPQPDTENEVYWSYNSSKTPDGSFTLTNWWPLKRHSNNSSKTRTPVLILAILLSMVIFLR